MFRFSIRDVLWLTALVAMACAWGLDHWAASSRYQAREQRMKELNAQATTHWKLIDTLTKLNKQNLAAAKAAKAAPNP